MFWVRVPVLSEQIQVVDPRVSIDSRFFTRTFFFAIYLAVSASWMVTAATTPSGTLATSTPIAIMKFAKIPYPLINPRMKNPIASVNAIYEMYLMKRWISQFRVEVPVPALDARLAI